MDVEEEGGREGEGTLMALEATWFLTHKADPILKMLVDACNRFNKLSFLAMLWTVRHFWPVGARLALNCYKHWSQLLFRKPGEPTVTLLG